jgi:hypothetical protein
MYREKRQTLVIAQPLEISAGNRPISATGLE